MLLSASRVVCGVSGRRNNWLKMRCGKSPLHLRLDSFTTTRFGIIWPSESGSGANYLKAIIRNKSTEVGKESSRLEIRDGSLFSSSLSQSSSIPIRTRSQQRTFCSRVPGPIPIPTPRPTPTSTPHYPYRISEEIYEAIKNNSEPVVALESAIITHGMPYPDNIQTAMHLQTIIRQQGVIPATVGVIKGQLTVGLSDAEIETLGSSAKNGSTIGPSRTRVVKVSRRDLPYVLSQKLYGGTTVSGTIIAAVRAKIPIFVTGGLGGVHRGAESTFDISADLKELGRSPIAVISAGVKSILDIGKTLEYLETEGVCVCVLKKRELLTVSKENQRDSEKGVKDVGLPSKFPSFFTQESSFTAPYTVQNEMEAAQLLHSSIQFGLQSGILIAVPIPKEFAASGERIDAAIREALEKARREGINGKDMTPFLLGVVNELTGGKSLEANKHLVENNARVGAQIALQLARLRQTNDTLAAQTGSQSNDEDPPHSQSSKNPNQTQSQQHNSSSSHSQSHSTNDMSPPHSNSHPNHHNHNDPPEKLENLNKRNNGKDRDKGESSFDRKSKSASSKSSLNLHNLSRQSPIRNPMDKKILSTPVSTSYVSPTSISTPTRMLSSTSLTSSHTSNLGGAGGSPLNNTSNSAVTTRSPPPPPPPHHGPIDFSDSDHRNPNHNGNEPRLVSQYHQHQPQPNGQFLAPFPDEDEVQGPKSTSTSPSKPNSRDDFVKRVISKMDSESEGEGDAVKNRNGGGDVDISIRRMERKSSKSCVEVEPLEETIVPGKKESADHPFSSTTRPIVIGGTSLDLVLRIQEENIVSDGRTHKARIEAVPGGVGRNVVEALEKLGHGPLFISAIGNDLFGREILRNFSDNGMDSRGIFTSKEGNATAIYSALLNHEGECLFGLGDMTVHSEISPTALEEHAEDIRQASIVLVDGNIPTETMTAALQICSHHSIPVWFEPTEVRKAKKILEVPREYWQSLRYISPNLRELISIAGHGTGLELELELEVELGNESMDVEQTEQQGNLDLDDLNGKNITGAETTTGTTRVGNTSMTLIVDDDVDVGVSHWTTSNSHEIRIETDNVDGKRRVPLSHLILRSFHLFPALEIILLTRGKQGFYAIQRKHEGNEWTRLTLETRHFPAPELAEGKLKSVSGAGDCLNAGFISGLLGNLSLQECGARGKQCAKKSLESIFNVPTSFELGGKKGKNNIGGRVIEEPAHDREPSSSG